AEAYFPDPARWGTRVAAAAPDRPTSGICQPPVHALALARIAAVADAAGGADVERVEAALAELYPKVLAWHRYLATERDPQDSGLVSIYHPWESGTDNSPRFDAALARVAVGDLPPYRRRDTGHVADRAQRPSDAEYDRYLWLVELLRRAGYDDGRIAATHPFVVKDVLFSAILVAANDALGRLAARIGAPAADRALIAGWRDRGRAAVDARYDPGLRLCLDLDVRAGSPVAVRSVAGFAGLVAGGDRLPELVAELASPRFLGDDRLRWPVPPSTSPADPAFAPRTYWRGPSWPVISWLLWRSLVAAGRDGAATALRAASLDQVGTAGFAEYVEPFTGEPLGSPNQSWTAAVTLDWLADG
ncbi:MGH1-like glycoside hydrolase domain-containing protein, partial [Actinocatenispora thailandica]